MGTSGSRKFAVPIDTVKRSLDELRRHGRVAYAYIGVATVAVFPQLARRFGLPVTSGSWVQEVTRGGPAADAGIHAGAQTARFQVRQYRTGGDVIVKAGGRTLQEDDDLGRAIAGYRAGQEIELMPESGPPGEEGTAVDERRLDPELEATIYRIVQEALTNVSRHAEASKAVVRQITLHRLHSARSTCGGGSVGNCCRRARWRAGDCRCRAFCRR